MIIRRTVRSGQGVRPGPAPGAAPNGGAMPGVSAQGAAKGWTPTVANLMVLVVLEIVAFGVIRYVFGRIT